MGVCQNSGPNPKNFRANFSDPCLKNVYVVIQLSFHLIGRPNPILEYLFLQSYFAFHDLCTLVVKFWAEKWTPPIALPFPYSGIGRR